MCAAHVGGRKNVGELKVIQIQMYLITFCLFLHVYALRLVAGADILMLHVTLKSYVILINMCIIILIN